MLAGQRPKLGPNVRRRFAIHEAGHVVTHLVLGFETLIRVSIDDPDGGGSTLGRFGTDNEQTEIEYKGRLIYMLAGRAAEEILLGAPCSGSGGAANSDLGTATELAAAMEAGYGFGFELPLIHLDHAARAYRLVHDPDFAARVHERLEAAYVAAKALVKNHRAAIERLAAALVTHGALEGDEIAAAAGMRAQGGAATSSPP